MAFHFDPAFPPLLVEADATAAAGAAAPAAGSARRRPLAPPLVRQVAWSPDGLMLLLTTDHHAAAGFHVPRHTFMDCDGRAAVAAAPGGVTGGGAPLAAAVRVAEADALRDAAWHPHTSCAAAATALFATAAKDQPVKLWGALDGGARGAYVATNLVDEVVGAHSVAFSPDGAHLVGGFDRMLHRWDPSRPGGAAGRWLTTPARRSRDGQRDAIGALGFNPADPSAFAAGCWDGSVAVYDVRAWGGGGGVAAVGDGPGGDCVAAGGRPVPPPPGAARRCGVTQVAFSADGRFLAAGYRRRGELLVWDARRLSAPAMRLARADGTNQRQQFGMDGVGRHLVTGGADGAVVAFDLVRGEVTAVFTAPGELARGGGGGGGRAAAVPCVALHPAGVAFATATGERQLAGDTDSDSDGDGGECNAAQRPGGAVVAVWRCPTPPQTTDEAVPVA